MVNVHHSVQSWDLVIEFLEKSETLQELDLSWSIVKPGSWFDFLEVMRENRQLTTLTLSFNQILEDQNYKLSAEQRS